MRQAIGCAAILLALCLTGCGAPKTAPAANPTGETGTTAEGAASGEATPGEKSLRIAMIPKGSTHIFWQSVRYGAQQAADELGVELLWKGPLEESGRAEQLQIVESYIVDQVDGICLAPLDSQALIDVVHRAKDAGIPTLIFDSALDDESAIVSYVATDNFAAGQLAADSLGQLLNSQGDVILVRYNVGSESTHQREEGFLARLKQKFPNINVLSSDQYIGTTVAAGTEKCQTLLQQFHDEVDGIFAVCEPNTTSVLAALESQKLDGKVKCIGFDPSEAFVAAMKTNPPRINGVVLQDAVNMGRTSLQTIVKSLRGEQVEKRIKTGERIVTPENVDDPENTKLLNPPRTEAS
ncbi:MAG TPA: substrate-binding domain-containing protein [Pirellulales bacterium]